MADVTLPITDPTGDGDDTNYWSDVYSNLTAITDQVNGSLDADNLASNAVSSVKIQVGAVTDAKMGLTAHSDTQSADITATGVLTGISITPGAGTYLAIAEAVCDATTDVDARIAIRVNGTNVVTPESTFVAYNDGEPPNIQLTAHGFITPAAGQAVEVHGSLFRAGTIKGGRLSLVRIGTA